MIVYSQDVLCYNKKAISHTLTLQYYVCAVLSYQAMNYDSIIRLLGVPKTR